MSGSKNIIISQNNELAQRTPTRSARHDDSRTRCHHSSRRQFETSSVQRVGLHLHADMRNAVADAGRNRAEVGGSREGQSCRPPNQALSQLCGGNSWCEISGTGHNSWSSGRTGIEE